MQKKYLKKFIFYIFFFMGANFIKVHKFISLYKNVGHCLNITRQHLFCVNEVLHQHVFSQGVVELGRGWAATSGASHSSFFFLQKGFSLAIPFTRNHPCSHNPNQEVPLACPGSVLQSCQQAAVASMVRCSLPLGLALGVLLGLAKVDTSSFLDQTGESSSVCWGSKNLHLHIQDSSGRPRGWRCRKGQLDCIQA